MCPEKEELVKNISYLSSRVSFFKFPRERKEKSISEINMKDKSELPPPASLPLVSAHQANSDFAAGLLSGMFSAALFHPYDRALYLSVKNQTPFFTRQSFQSPLHGLNQTIIQRSVGGGIYFTCQAECSKLRPFLSQECHFSNTSIKLLLGVSVGSLNAMLLNPAVAVKYHSWSGVEYSFYSSASHMCKQGGIRPFYRGVGAGIKRDAIFGAIYEEFRVENNMQDARIALVWNLFAGTLASIGSSPLNYSRTVQYATPPEQKALTTHRIIFDLLCSTIEKSSVSLASGFWHAQNRLQLGVGTVRVAAGMAVGQEVFNRAQAEIARLS